MLWVLWSSFIIYWSNKSASHLIAQSQGAKCKQGLTLAGGNEVSFSMILSFLDFLEHFWELKDYRTESPRTSALPIRVQK